MASPSQSEFESSLDASLFIDRELSTARDQKRYRNSIMFNAPTSEFRRQPLVSTNGAHESLGEWRSGDGAASALRGSEDGPSDIRRYRQSDRDGMLALAEFLRTKEPPPHNNEFTPLQNKKCQDAKIVSFKIFGRKKSVRRKSMHGLMRLPDSAVSAKTNSGVRYLAISIPEEHDPLFNISSPFQQNFVQKANQALPKSGAVVVLKPFVSLPPVGENVQRKRGVYPGRGRKDSRVVIADHAPPKSSQHGIADAMPTKNSQVTIADPVPLKNTEEFGKEDTKMLEQLYAQIQLANLQKNANGTAKPKMPYISIPPTGTPIRDSQRTDPRHSGGTVYGTSSFKTKSRKHSRNISSVSISPSISQVISASLGHRPQKSSLSGYRQEPGLTDDDDDGEVTFGRSMQTDMTNRSPVTPTFFGTAQVIRTYKRSLRDGEASTCVPELLPQPDSMPSEQINGVATNEHLREIEPLNVKSKSGSTTETQKSRQERVKARKAKDMAALRERSNNNSRDSRFSLDELSHPVTFFKTNDLPSQDEMYSPNKFPSPKPAVPPKSNARLSIHKCNSSYLSGIMVVAESPPYTGFVRESDLVLPRPAKTTAKKVASFTNPLSTSTSAVEDTGMPITQSLLSLGSYASELSPDTLQPPTPCTVTNTSITTLQTHRDERRTRRNTVLRQKELDARIRRLEHDNLVMLATLRRMARGYGGLSTLLASGSPAGERAYYDGMTAGNGGLVPLMRELQGVAGRVSNECAKRDDRVLGYKRVREDGEGGIHRGNAEDMWAIF
ncbi:hypothetical protein BJ878DRAFT_476839 [Calycina marina]|uniref:Uncharacterized protein n=1 Tax=Calycina marina TaxID=1763456 RepID=A0A9P8CI67_9HELO|nr:hypothetical protein BJ878DRAFT_476839 [Calycina marina]